MTTHRSLEIILGVFALVSVVSVPVRQGPVPSQVHHPARVDISRLEEIQRITVAQHQQIISLRDETSAISRLLREHPPTSQGRVVHPDAGARTPTHEVEYECSQ
jgi:hypothetical protein